MLSVFNNYINDIHDIITEKNKCADKNKYTEYSEEYKYINNFRKQKLEERIQISDKILLKYKNRVPIIVDTKNDIQLDKNKYIVPDDLTIAQFMFILKKRIFINSEQSVFLLCNNLLVTNTQLIKNVYYNNKDYDGFLYIIIALENTFGTHNN